MEAFWLPGTSAHHNTFVTDTVCTSAALFVLSMIYYENMMQLYCVRTARCLKYGMAPRQYVTKAGGFVILTYMLVPHNTVSISVFGKKYPWVLSNMSGSFAPAVYPLIYLPTSAEGIKAVVLLLSSGHEATKVIELHSNAHLSTYLRWQLEDALKINSFLS